MAPATLNLAAGAGPWTVKVLAGNVVVTNAAEATVISLAPGGNSLDIVGTGGDDTIYINHSLGGAVSLGNGFTIDGGNGNDTVVVIGTGNTDSATFTPSSPNGGTFSGIGSNVTLSKIEGAVFDGGGGNDNISIFGTASNDTFDFTPGIQADSGVAMVNSLLPLAIQNINTSGAINFLDQGGTSDRFLVHGTPGNDNFSFNVAGTGTISMQTDVASVLGGTNRSRINIPSVGNLIEGVLFDSLGGDDNFVLNTNITLLPLGLAINAGADGVDRLTINGTGTADVITMSLSSSNDSIAGVYASQILLNSLEQVTFSMGGGDDVMNLANLGADSRVQAISYFSGGDAGDVALATGTVGNDTFTVVPQSATLLNISANGIGPVFSPSMGAAATSTIQLDGSAGQDLVNVLGTAASESIGITKGTTTNVTVGALKTVGISAVSTEAVTVQGREGADTFAVSGTAFSAQALNVDGGAPTSNSASAADTLAVNLTTAGATTLAPGATPDSGAITNPDGAIGFSGFEFLTVTGSAGVNSLTIQGTHANDTMTLQPVGGTNRAWINDRAVTSFSGFSTVNFNGLLGDDLLEVTPAGLLGVLSVFVNGGGGDDKLTVLGTASADAFDISSTDPVSGSVINSGVGVGYLNTETLLVAGLSGADIFDFEVLGGNVQLRGDEGADAITFSNASSGIVFDMDAVGTLQTVSANGQNITLRDTIENLTGSPFNDVIFAKATPFARTVNGGANTGGGTGDQLHFDSRGLVSSLLPADSNTGTIKTTSLADLTFDGIETKTISGLSQASLGIPGASNAFNTAQAYDLTLFTNGTTPAPGKAPAAVATADLNGDGFSDLVTANALTKNLSVLLNNGDGTFQDPVNISTGSASPADLVLGDFDKDGLLDAVVALPTASALGFMKGDGLGGFAAPTKVSTGKFKPTSIAAGDMNVDGSLDVVAASKATGKVMVLIGDGTGAFTANPEQKTLGKLTSDIIVADINDDSKPDVVTANTGSNNISFFAGDGSGNLEAVRRFATGVAPTSLVAADFDNDGDMDVAVSNSVSRFVSVLLGNGAVQPANQFARQLRIVVAGPHNSTTIVAGDFDGDGVLDIGLGNRTSVNFTVLRGMGKLAFSQPFEINLGNDLTKAATGGVALADFDNDGRLDVATTSLLLHDVRVLLRK